VGQQQYTGPKLFRASDKANQQEAIKQSIAKILIEILANNPKS